MPDLGRVVGHHPGVALTEKRAGLVALIRQGSVTRRRDVWWG